MRSDSGEQGEKMDSGFLPSLRGEATVRILAGGRGWCGSNLGLDPKEAARALFTSLPRCDAGGEEGEA